MNSTEKRAALLAMLAAAAGIARDLAADLTASHEQIANSRNFTSDNAASNTTVGAMLTIETACQALESMRAAAVALNVVRT